MHSISKRKLFLIKVNLIKTKIIKRKIIKNNVQYMFIKIFKNYIKKYK